MIMTRPQYIYLLPIYLLFWILKYFMDKKEKKKVLVGIISCIISISVLLIYCGLMKMQHGEFSMTAVSYINSTVTAVNSNLYKRATNRDMVNIVDEQVKESNDGTTAFLALNALKEKYSTDEIKDFAKDSLKYDSEYIKYLVKKTINLGTANIGTAEYVVNKDGYQNINYTTIGNIILPINFAIVYIMLAIAIVYLIFKLIKYKRINWIIAFLTSIIFANLFTLLVGAPFESQRLFFPSIIPVLLLIGLVISNIKEDNMSEKDKEKEMEQTKQTNWLYKLFIEKTDDVKTQFFRYLFVGGFAAIVNIGSLYIFKEFANMHYLLANVLGFILGLITNYILSKWLVFAKENKMNGIIEFATYTIIGVVGLGLDTLFIWIFTDKVKLYYMLSKIVSTALVFIWNFFARKALYIVANKINKN